LNISFFYLLSESTILLHLGVHEFYLEAALSYQAVFKILSAIFIESGLGCEQLELINLYNLTRGLRRGSRVVSNLSKIIYLRGSWA